MPKRPYPRVSATVALTIVLAIVPCAGAALLAIDNPSFETVVPPLGPGQVSNFTGGIPAGWTFSDVSGVWYPNSFGVNPMFGNVFLPSAQAQINADGGHNVAFSDSGVISQTLTATLQANTHYTLSLLVGDRLDLVNTNTVFSYGLYDLTTNTLLAGATNVTEADAFGGAGVPLKGTFVTQSADFTSGTTGVGDALGIKLFASGVEYSFDQVTLDATTQGAAVAPLPTGAGAGFLLLTALGAMAWTKRRPTLGLA